MKLDIGICCFRILQRALSDIFVRHHNILANLLGYLGGYSLHRFVHLTLGFGGGGVVGVEDFLYGFFLAYRLARRLA